MNSRCLKAYRAYSISFSSGNVGEFYGICLDLNSKGPDRSSGKEECRCLVFSSSTKREIWYFHVLLGPTMAKKCTKKHAARAKFSVVLLACQFVTCRRILFPFSMPPLVTSKVDLGYTEGNSLTKEETKQKQVSH